MVLSYGPEHGSLKNKIEVTYSITELAGEQIWMMDLVVVLLNLVNTLQANAPQGAAQQYRNVLDRAWETLGPEAHTLLMLIADQQREK